MDIERDCESYGHSLQLLYRSFVRVITSSPSVFCRSNVPAYYFESFGFKIHLASSSLSDLFKLRISSVFVDESLNTIVLILISRPCLLYTLQCQLSKHELATISARAERHIGTQGGGMDQAIAFLGKAGNCDPSLVDLQIKLFLGKFD